MTPTREQVIEWAKAAGIYPANAETIDMISSLAALAYSAGRLKGLDEAEACADSIRDMSVLTGGQERWLAARDISYAIGQLKEQTP